LVNNPGEELEQLFIRKILCIKPFNVEYARVSRTRSNAPTLVPVPDGLPVEASILVLNETVTEADVISMLYRREIRANNKNTKYKKTVNPDNNTVEIKAWENFNGINKVLYTSIGANMGILNSPIHLAHFAIESALDKAGETKTDGIHYLLNNINNGVITQRTEEYKNEILKKTQSNSLEEAIKKIDKLRLECLKLK